MTDYSEDYRSTEQIVDVSLKVDGGFEAVLQRARDLANARGLILPDDDLLDAAVGGLMAGHVILEGPPGTGKTTLASILGEAFNVSTALTTATSDWSTYDVIGGFQPDGSQGNSVEVLAPWLGEVTRAALDCANTTALHETDPQAQAKQAHWLIVDEFNRAEIDKAFGALYTSLGGSGGLSRKIPLWFGGGEEKGEIWMIERFRMIGTLNSVDTAYVFTLSEGLQRRFLFVYVGVPREDQVEEELDSAAAQAAAWHVSRYGGDEAAIRDGGSMAKAKELVGAFVKAVRYPDAEKDVPGWPVGTAQLVSVLRDCALRAATDPTDAAVGLRAADLGIANRIIPQMSGLNRVQLDQCGEVLKAAPLDDLSRTASALLRVRSTQRTAFG